MPQLTRGRYIIYIDASFGGTDPDWVKIGKGIESLQVDLSPDVSVAKDITDEVTATDNGYTPQTNVDPFYANPDDKIYSKIKDIAMNRLVGAACRTQLMEVIVEDETEDAHEAWTENVLVKPTSTGGGTDGFTIPYDVYFDGGRTVGTVSYPDKDYKKGTPTFEETKA